MPFFSACFWKAVGDADAIGAGIVEDVDRLHLQVLGEVIRHVRALEGVRRHGAEIDRLALRLELVRPSSDW